MSEQENVIPEILLMDSSLHEAFAQAVAVKAAGSFVKTWDKLPAVPQGVALIPVTGILAAHYDDWMYRF